MLCKYYACASLRLTIEHRQSRPIDTGNTSVWPTPRSSVPTVPDRIPLCLKACDPVAKLETLGELKIEG
jgi:hypothetical protein